MTVPAILVHRPAVDAAGYVTCPDCPKGHETPVLQVIGNTLVVVSRHHGERHKTVVTLQELLDFVAALP